MAVLTLTLLGIIAWPVEAWGAVRHDARDEGRREVEVTGTLTNEGVECQAMRSDDGKLYTLTGDLKGFKVGDKVRVVGTVAEVSTCMQGITVSVTKIQPA
jgi:hypothetical protein